MERALIIVILLGAGATAPLPQTIAAHHSFAAVYDQNKPVHVEGVVERVEWKNPHVLIEMTSTSGDKTAHWLFEMGAPPVLMREFGWSPDTVAVGDRISIDGYAARTGDGQAAAWTVTTRSGIRLRAVRPFR